MVPTILFVASGSLWAGAEMQVYTLMDSTKDKANLIAVLFSEGILARKLRESGIEVHIIDESQNGLFSMVKQLKNILISRQVKLIHTHGYKENIVGSLAGFLAGIPSLRTVHGDNEFKVSFWDFKRSIPANLNVFTGKFFQKKIVSVSAELAEKLSKKFPRKKTIVIPNGLNIDKVIASAKGSIELPGEKDSFKLVFIGRLVKLKRVDLILNAYAELFKQNNLEYELYVVGEGVEEANLKKQAEELGIDSGVHFLGHREDVYSIMKSMNCLLMASDHEGLPMTVLEAISLQLPIISHAVGEIPEVLEQGKCGYLIKEQTPTRFKQAIIQCRNNSDQTIMTQRALERVREHYSHTQNSAQYFSLYQSILQN